MNILDAYVALGAIIGLIVFAIYLVFDFGATNQNVFLDKWVKKSLWLWLPFYGLQRLIKEVILKK